MKLWEMSAQVKMLRLERALFSILDLVEIVIRHRIIEISLSVIQRIEIHDVSGDFPLPLIQGIKIQKMTSKFKDLRPIRCLEGHFGEKQIGRQVLAIDSR